MKRWELEAAYARRGEEVRELQGRLGRHAAETGAQRQVIEEPREELASDIMYHLGVSYAKIGDFFDTVLDRQAGRSGLLGGDPRLAARAGPMYWELLDLVRRLWQVRVDETGWRIATPSAWLQHSGLPVGRGRPGAGLPNRATAIERLCALHCHSYAVRGRTVNTYSSESP